ncbi:MAG: hypothetical protein HC831_06435 [Chloroflexia bacterium]|nr:hypothetical protein [Chloroflexia bacterium]
MKVKSFVYLLLSIFLFALVSCGGSEANGEENDNPDSNIVNNIKDVDDQDFTLPEELAYTSTRHGFNYDKFYPIGWSKDGKFAYIMEPADEGSGFYLFEIVILDIVNNKLVWSWKPEESEDGNVQSTWKENYDLFAQHLNEAEIIPTKDFKLEPTSASYKGNDYEIIMETASEVDPDYGVDMIKEIEINLQSTELGVKQIYNQKTDGRDYILSAYIPGFLLSQHDDRIVVICQKERIGAGGPPNIVFFELIGSDLIRGFKKREEWVIAF